MGISEDARWPARGAWLARINQSGELTGPGRRWLALVELLRHLAEDPAKAAGEAGRLTGSCCFCGLALTDARSTGVGYGPTCAEKWQLPWG